MSIKAKKFVYRVAESVHRVAGTANMNADIAMMMLSPKRKAMFLRISKHDGFSADAALKAFAHLSVE